MQKISNVKEPLRNIKVIDSTEEMEFEYWTKFKKFSIQELFDELDCSEIERRYAAARELQIRGSKIIFDCMNDLIKDVIPAKRAIAAFILGQLGTPDFPYRNDSIPLLSELLESDEDAEVRANSASGLGHLCSDSSFGVLCNASQDISSEVRKSVAFALGCISNAASIKPLLELLNDDDSDVRSWAALSIGQIDIDYDSISNDLIKSLSDSCEEVRSEVIGIMAAAKDGRVYDSICAELEMDEVSFDVIEAAGNLGDIRLLDVLLDLQEKWQPDIPLELDEAINKLNRK